MKRALITGITGQDGAYLAQHLLQLNYQVFGLSPRRSSDNLWRLRTLGIMDGVEFLPGDVTDYASVSAAVCETHPDEVYNLAAQSFVGISFKQPLQTMEVNALGALNVLDATRRHAPAARFYQASTSEMFGMTDGGWQDEDAPFHPRSPYGVSKLAAHWAVINYREAYGMHASCGILFNHESPLRGEEFVTRKIAMGVAAVAAGKQEKLVLGHLGSYRDWGHARDYVDGMHRMLQQDAPGDYVLATGKTWTVAEFLDAALTRANINDECVEFDNRFKRPSDVPHLRGDARKAEVQLGWTAKTGFHALVNEMVDAELTKYGLRPREESHAA